MEFSGIEYAFAFAADIKKNIFTADTGNNRINLVAGLQFFTADGFFLKQVCKFFFAHSLV